MIEEFEFHIEVCGDNNAVGVYVITTSDEDEAIEQAFLDFEEEFPEDGILSYEVFGKYDLK